MICGSTAELSHTRTVMRVVAAALTFHDLTPLWYDLREHPLPLADPRFHHSPREHPDPRVRDLIAQAGQAEAFVLGSPVYHNSYSGVLKNCLDHLTIEQFAGKPCGFVCNGGRLRSFQPCDHLRIVVRGLHSIAIVSQVVTATTDFVTDGELRLANKDVLLRVWEFARELSAYAYACRTMVDGNGRPGDLRSLAVPVSVLSDVSPHAARAATRPAGKGGDNGMTEEQIQEQLQELLESLACLDSEDVEDEVETATRASFW